MPISPRPSILKSYTEKAIVFHPPETTGSPHPTLTQSQRQETGLTRFRVKVQGLGFTVKGLLHLGLWAGAKTGKQQNRGLQISGAHFLGDLIRIYQKETSPKPLTVFSLDVSSIILHLQRLSPDRLPSAPCTCLRGLRLHS